MNNSTPMATSHPPPQRPSYPPPNVSYRSDYGQPNGRPSPVAAQSPQMMNFSSPSPQQQFSPPLGQPAAKRPRLSPDAPSPFAGSPYPQTPSGQAQSPVGGMSVNGSIQQPTRPGSMAPPQRPLERDPADAQNGSRDWQGGGANLKEDERNTPGVSFGSLPSPNGLYPNQPSNYNPNNTSMARPGSSGQGGQGQGQGQGNQGDDPTRPQPREPTAEEHQKRVEERADWEAARHSQNPLWDMFLHGGSLNDRVRQISLREHLNEPQHGVLINTQKTGPPPIARVLGQEGASRVIDKGQAILDLHKGDRLGEVMKLISLATKARLTGLVSSSARLSMERREHSKGRVPIDWQDVAVVPDASVQKATLEGSEGTATFNPLKRTHDQANSDSGSQRAGSLAPENKSIAIFSKIMQEEKAAEEARRAKRAKRKAATDAANQAAQTAAEEEAVAAAGAGADPVKKGKKAEKARNATADNAHQQVNAAAQLAMSNLGGRKGKSYSWMTGGGSGASTPSRPGLASSVSTPKPVERPKPVAKEKGFAAWDEDKDPGIQVRDVLLVLETDGKAPRAYTKASAMLDG